LWELVEVFWGVKNIKINNKTERGGQGRKEVGKPNEPGPTTLHSGNSVLRGEDQGKWITTKEALQTGTEKTRSKRREGKTTIREYCA